MGEHIKEDIQDIKDANGATYEIEIDIINQAEIMKHMRNIRIKMDGKGFSNYYTPYDKETEKFTACSYRYDYVSFINLAPREVICIKLFGDIPKKDLEKVNGKAKMYLTWHEQNRQKIFKLGRIDFK